MNNLPDSQLNKMDHDYRNEIDSARTFSCSIPRKMDYCFRDYFYFNHWSCL